MSHANNSAALAVSDATLVDAYSTTGTSPTRNRTAQLRVAASGRPQRRGYDTVHLLGPGSVGTAVLRRIAADRRRLVAVTDSTATVRRAEGLDADAVIAWKEAGRALCDHPLAELAVPHDAIAWVDADIVADCSPTDLDRPLWTAALNQALERGACVVSAAKAAWCDAGAAWLSGEHRTRVGCNAVLGGTGRSFAAELPELQRRTRGVVIVGNASTTAILNVIERGGTLQDGIGEAGRLGFLEPDPELDLRGTDAAVKLAIVAGVLTGRRIDPRSIDCEDIRSLDPVVVRGRTRRNCTTRLAARLHADHTLSVRYEEFSCDSLLAAPCGRVVYEYRLDRDERRMHIGSGLGADATAGALWTDLCATAAQAGVRNAVTGVAR